MDVCPQGSGGHKPEQKGRDNTQVQHKKLFWEHVGILWPSMSSSRQGPDTTQWLLLSVDTGPLLPPEPQFAKLYDSIF